MRAIYYKRTGKWRIIIPPRLTGTGKRKCRYFETKEQAESAAIRWEQNPLDNEAIERAVQNQKLGFLKIKPYELAAIQAILDSIRNNTLTVIVTEKVTL